MIKPVTFQGVENFKANLYALEVRSRFVDQSAANGYYAGYGNELAATVSSNVISIGTGAFLVQGRLIEVETAESLSVVIQNGKYGLVVARIETYPAANTANCSLVVRTGNSISSLLSGLTQENTYQYAAETTNKVYELPLYSFYMTGGAITITEKVISEIKEITEIKQKADTAKSTADTAAANASTALNTANAAADGVATLSAIHLYQHFISFWFGSSSGHTSIYIEFSYMSTSATQTPSDFLASVANGEEYTSNYSIIATGRDSYSSTEYPIRAIHPYYHESNLLVRVDRASANSSFSVSLSRVSSTTHLVKQIY